MVKEMSVQAVGTMLSIPSRNHGKNCSSLNSEHTNLSRNRCMCMYMSVHAVGTMLNIPSRNYAKNYSSLHSEQVSSQSESTFVHYIPPVGTLVKLDHLSIHKHTKTFMVLEDEEDERESETLSSVLSKSLDTEPLRPNDVFALSQTPVTPIPRLSRGSFNSPKKKYGTTDDPLPLMMEYLRTPFWNESRSVSSHLRDGLMVQREYFRKNRTHFTYHIELKVTDDVTASTFRDCIPKELRYWGLNCSLENSCVTRYRVTYLKTQPQVKETIFSIYLEFSETVGFTRVFNLLNCLNERRVRNQNKKDAPKTIHHMFKRDDVRIISSATLSYITTLIEKGDKFVGVVDVGKTVICATGEFNKDKGASFQYSEFNQKPRVRENKKDMAYDLVMTSVSDEEARSKIMDKCPSELRTPFVRALLDGRFHSTFEPKDIMNVKPHFREMPEQIREALFGKGPDKIGQRTVWIWGKAGYGKSELVKAWCPTFFYSRSRQSLAVYNDYDFDGIIMDDFCPQPSFAGKKADDTYPTSELLNVLDPGSASDHRVLYSTTSIGKGTPRIVTSNESVELLIARYRLYNEPTEALAGLVRRLFVVRICESVLLPGVNDNATMALSLDLGEGCTDEEKQEDALGFVKRIDTELKDAAFTEKYASVFLKKKSDMRAPKDDEDGASGYGFARPAAPLAPPPTPFARSFSTSTVARPSRGEQRSDRYDRIRPPSNASYHRRKAEAAAAKADSTTPTIPSRSSGSSSSDDRGRSKFRRVVSPSPTPSRPRRPKIVPLSSSSSGSSSGSSRDSSPNPRKRNGSDVDTARKRHRASAARQIDFTSME